ncbi:MAG: DNA polymerase ligase N-terminal domain-containing protein [Myxococcales bacterium]|jgi:bifunctional non-homologous end joining protein LigD
MAKRLEPYEKKRDFRVTPEPSPRAGPRRREGTPLFMVHKHDATRLHYDLRLEIGGALASWAIPKGPSYDPAQKRLAIETEDHPLAYADFEGRIPDGEYGGGDSLIWDRGTWHTDPPGQEQQQRAKGHLKLVLEGQKLKGLWHLVRTRRAGEKQQWLLFKAKDEWADPAYDVLASRPESVVSGRRITRGPVTQRRLRAPHPEPIQLLLKVWPPMRASLADPEHLGRGPWKLEVKYDGYRGLAALSGGRIALQSRDGHDLSAQFPELARALSTITVGEAVIDGVIAAFDERGLSSFEHLQRPGSDRAFVAFDLLWLEGEDLRTRPLEERWELLESLLFGSDPAIRLAERMDGAPQGAIEQARSRGIAALIAKRVGAAYRGGESREWQKLVVSPTQDVVIAGFEPASTKMAQVGSLLVAVREGDGFVYAGRVEAGLTSARRRELWRLLEKDRTADPPAAGLPRACDVHWIEPKHVAHVALAAWTEDGQLRDATFEGLRTDKSPLGCRRELPRAARRSGKSASGRTRPRR